MFGVTSYLLDGGHDIILQKKPEAASFRLKLNSVVMQVNSQRLSAAR